MDDSLRLLLPLALLFLVVGFGLRLILGNEAYAQMVGTLAADVMRFLLLFPFRALRWLARRIRSIP